MAKRVFSRNHRRQRGSCSRLRGDEAAKGPAGDKTSHEHCTRGKHTTATSAEFRRAQLCARSNACACITRKRGTMRCHSWQKKKRLNHRPLGFYRFIQREKVYCTRYHIIERIDSFSSRFLSPPRGRGAINSLFRLEPSRSKIR